MLFNSIDFALFLPVVFIFYWLLNDQKLKYQNLFLLVASYIFYGWWDWRFLSLIIISSCVDYWIGIRLEQCKRRELRKYLLLSSIVVNLGLLGFFKYFNFFVGNFVAAFTLFGKNIEARMLNIILPVGISFYTFQTLSYTIDIYREKIKPTKDIIAFFAFVSFFPQLVAGPIERAANLLPQFFKKRIFDYEKAADGTRQIVWGLFKKIVIADNCAPLVSNIFTNYQTLPGSDLLLGGFLFAFQIYCDFSGYSDIAIGTARLFGFRLMRNFAFPYFSRDIAEFWRRWHISLSTWFRDYVYISLGGSRGTTGKIIRNTFIIFIVSGFWHGANWTFIAWGFLNAVYFLPFILTGQNRKHLDIVAQERIIPSIKEFCQIGLTFGFTLIAWIFFRADTIGHACLYIKGIFSASIFAMPTLLPRRILVLIFITVLIEWFQRDKQHALEIGQRKSWFRRMAYAFIFVLIFFGGNFEKNAFIYFQF